MNIEIPERFKEHIITLTGGPADGQTYTLDRATLFIALPTMGGLAYYGVEYDPTLSVPIGARYVENPEWQKVKKP